jgi:hypothetical protein
MSKTELRKFCILKLQDIQKIPKEQLKGTRVLILIADSPSEIKLDKLDVPIILVLKSQVQESIVEASHICFATENSKIGNFSASEALRRKIINRIVAESSIETEAIKVAERISDVAAPLAVRAVLEAVIEGEKLSLEEGLKLEAKLFEQIFSTEDAYEGIKAFLEKRCPNFQGK